MWFYPLLLALVILAIVGGTLAGGIFAIVLVPLAAVVFISGIVYSRASAPAAAAERARAQLTTAARGHPTPAAVAQASGAAAAGGGGGSFAASVINRLPRLRVK